jgi:hypothetical protein
MAPWVSDLIRDTATVVVGWALGLGSALLVDWKRDRKKTNAVPMAASSANGPMVSRSAPGTP